MYKEIMVDMSNHPLFKDVDGNPIQRKIYVKKVSIDWLEKSVILECLVKYYNNENEDITSLFTQKFVLLPATDYMYIPDTDSEGNPIMVEEERQVLINGQLQYNADETPMMETIEVMQMISFYQKLIYYIDQPVPLQAIITQYLNFNLDKFE